MESFYGSDSDFTADQSELSPIYDRLSETISKCEQYHGWGVPFVWIIDPDERRAWEFPQGHRLHEIREDGMMSAGPITLALADVFRAL